MSQYAALKKICDKVEFFRKDEDLMHILDNFLSDSIDYIFAFGEYYAMPTVMKMGGKFYELPSAFILKKLAKQGYTYLYDLYIRIKGSLDFSDAISDTRFMAVQSIKHNIMTGDEKTDSYAKRNYEVFRKSNYFINSLVSTGKIPDDSVSRDALRILLYLKQAETVNGIAENIDDQIPEDVENLEEELVRILYRNPIIRENEVSLYVSIYVYPSAKNSTLYDLKEYYDSTVGELIETIKKQDYISGLEGGDGKEFLEIEDIDFMSGTEFEKFIADSFSKIGYVTELTKSSGDQGVDILAKKGNATIAIQTKRYTRNITNSAIQEVVAGRDYYHADKCMVITSSYFTDSAKELADANNVILWDRDVLSEKLAGHYFG